MAETVKIIECPRDAMQGLGRQIPWSEKAAYIETLLGCGFHTLDCGSFVNPAAVPQMADTAQVLNHLEDKKGVNRFLVIVANNRGAKEAVKFGSVDDLGFPFSINETFQLRNANSDISTAFTRLEQISETAAKGNKSVVAYISMAFGNPYGDVYDRDAALYWVEKIRSLGIKTISLADTVGSAADDDIKYLFGEIHRLWPDIETGAHFHARPGEWQHKISSSWESGCRRFDGAIMGYGGCPFANDDLTGNVPTENLVDWLSPKGNTGIHLENLAMAVNAANRIFNH